MHTHNIKSNLKKCEFLKESIVYCGFTIDKNGLQKIKEKIEGIEYMSRPKNKSKVRAFAGFINYYNRFIKNASLLLRLIQYFKKWCWIYLEQKLWGCIYKGQKDISGRYSFKFSWSKFTFDFSH